MSYRIVDHDTKHTIETHVGPMSAFRAMLVLSAHEVKNGRKPNYRVEPPVFYRLEEVSPPLAPWVLEALEVGREPR